MHKNTNQILGRPNTIPMDFGILKLEVCGPLQDITQAALMPNYRLEVSDPKTHERGALFLRVFDVSYDPDRHDSSLVHLQIVENLQNLCRNQSDELRLSPAAHLMNFDRSAMMGNRFGQNEWSPEQAALFQYNAHAILAQANAIGNGRSYASNYLANRGSTIAFEADDRLHNSYRFDLLLTNDLRFYAIPKHSAHGDIVPMPYVMGADLHPLARDEYARTAAAVQGEFVFYGVDYVFAFVQPLFRESLVNVFAKPMLANALETALATQFPFFMPPRGAEVGVKLLNLKFK